MTPQDEQKCIELTSEFYAAVADSFSATRQSPWNGWKRCLDTINEDLARDEKVEGITILDLACGNLRFEEFLITENVALTKAICIDNCPKLLDDISPLVEYECVDIFEDLPIRDYSVDISVCFGFIHHVPSKEKRKEILKYLLDTTKRDGYVVVSFWQFLKDSRLQKKSYEATISICEKYSIAFEDENDRFLHWQDNASVARYCHNFTDQEIDSLLEELGEHIEIVDIFNADGKDENLNRYVVLRNRN